MKKKTSALILDYLKKNKRVRPRELERIIKIGKRALYKQLASLVKLGKITKYGQPPNVMYALAEYSSIEGYIENVKAKPYKINKQQQIKELINRVPPIVNVNIVIYKDGKYLMGSRSKKKDKTDFGVWLYPGGRMHYFESPQETAMRILKNEVPGVKATLRRLITVEADRGVDPRSYNINLYYLLEYESGAPKSNFQLNKFNWFTKEELLQEKRAYWIQKALVDEIDTAIRLMNTNADELLVEADLKDKAIGVIAKRDAHATNQRYHRAAHIMIFTSGGDVVLHQRSMNKITSPGKWDMFGGHQVPGHTIEQTAVAELSEELGITTNLQFVRKDLYKSKFQAEFYYLYYGVDDGPYGFDRNEVAQIRVFNCQKLLNGDYADDFEILEHVYGYVKELEGVWRPLKEKV